MAVSTTPGLPAPWPVLLHLVCAVALGALGYNATDCERCPGNRLRVAAGLCVLVCASACAGCTLSHLSFGVSSPTFGKLQMSVGGGSIGRTVTNCPPDLPTQPGATNTQVGGS